MIKDISTGAIEDAINELSGTYQRPKGQPAILDLGARMRAADNTRRLLDLFQQNDWEEYVETRPDWISKELREQYGTEDEVYRLHTLVNELMNRIVQLRRERDRNLSDWFLDRDLDAAFLTALRLLGEENASNEDEAKRWRKEKFEAKEEVRKLQAEARRVLGREL